MSSKVFILDAFLVDLICLRPFQWQLERNISPVLPLNLCICAHSGLQARGASSAPCERYDYINTGCVYV